jgi:CheY-like chemotaxis protein
MSESSGYILVADDDALVLRSLTFVLERAGFELRTATNGLEALAIAREEAPAVALLDVMMPEMTGLELCRTLKNEPATANVPVFLVTARAMVSERARGVAAGADAYVTKPFVNKELIKQVRKAFELSTGVKTEG